MELGGLDMEKKKTFDLSHSTESARRALSQL